MAKITPNLWFDGNAEEAADFYVSLLPDSRVERPPDRLHARETSAQRGGRRLATPLGVAGLGRVSYCGRPLVSQRLAQVVIIVGSRREICMKRLLAGFALASMLVFSQASPALGEATYVRILPYSQGTSFGYATTWNITWRAPAGYWQSWQLYYGDRSMDSGMSSGNVSLAKRHQFKACGTFLQTLVVTDYSSYPYVTNYNNSYTTVGGAGCP